MIMNLEFLMGFSNWRIIELEVIISSIEPINKDLRLRIGFKI